MSSFFFHNKAFGFRVVCFVFFFLWSKAFKFTDNFPFVPKQNNLFFLFSVFFFVVFFLLRCTMNKLWSTTISCYRKSATAADLFLNVLSSAYVLCKEVTLNLTKEYKTFCFLLTQSNFILSTKYQLKSGSHYAFQISSLACS